MRGEIGPTPATAGPEKQLCAINTRTPKFKKVCIIEHTSRVSVLMMRRDYGRITTIPKVSIFHSRR